MNPEQNLKIEENNNKIPLTELEISPSGDPIYFAQYDEQYLDEDQIQEIKKFGIENKGNVSNLYINIKDNSEFQGAKVLFDTNGNPQFLLFSEEIDSILQLENINKEVLNRSTRDFLADLHNREGWDIELKKLSENIQRGNLNEKYITFAMFDLNDLGEVNNTLGHSKGDELLINMARHLEHSFRSNDEISRWGGDEFITFSVSDVEISDTIKERLESLQNENVKYSAGILSFKVDTILKEIDTLQNTENQSRSRKIYSNLLEKIEKTDEILYQAKEVSKQSDSKPTTIVAEDYETINISL